MIPSRLWNVLGYVIVWLLIKLESLRDAVHIE